MSIRDPYFDCASLVLVYCKGDSKGIRLISIRYTFPSIRVGALAIERKSRTRKGRYEACPEAIIISLV